MRKLGRCLLYLTATQMGTSYFENLIANVNFFYISSFVYFYLQLKVYFCSGAKESDGRSWGEAL